MYASEHGVVGAAIVVAAAQVDPAAGLVAMVPAFLSHWYLDWIGEAGFPTKRQTVIWEVVPFLSFACAAYLSGHGWLFAAGWFAGNLMDIVDKRAYLAPLLGWQFGMTFHRNNPARFPITLTQTKLAAIGAAIAPWVMAWVLI